MKKTLLTVFLILVVCFTVVSCDEEEESNSNTASNQAQEAVTIKGEEYETDDFSIIIAEGFSKMDIEGGVQAYKGSHVLEIWVRGSNLSEDEAKNAAEQLSNTNKGTEPEKTEKFGLTFYATSFEAFGNPQTIYTAIKDGQKVQIGLTGEDHQNQEQLQGMFNSISFK